MSPPVRGFPPTTSPTASCSAITAASAGASPVTGAPGNPPFPPPPGLSAPPSFRHLENLEELRRNYLEPQSPCFRNRRQALGLFSELLPGVARDSIARTHVLGFFRDLSALAGDASLGETGQESLLRDLWLLWEQSESQPELSHLVQVTVLSPLQGALRQRGHRPLDLGSLWSLVSHNAALRESAEVSRHALRQLEALWEDRSLPVAIRGLALLLWREHGARVRDNPVERQATRRRLRSALEEFRDPWLFRWLLFDTLGRLGNLDPWPHTTFRVLEARGARLLEQAIERREILLPALRGYARWMRPHLTRPRSLPPWISETEWVGRRVLRQILRRYAEDAEIAGEALALLQSWFSHRPRSWVGDLPARERETAEALRDLAVLQTRFAGETPEELAGAAIRTELRLAGRLELLHGLWGLQAASSRAEATSRQAAEGWRDEIRGRLGEVYERWFRTAPALAAETGRFPAWLEAVASAAARTELFPNRAYAERIWRFSLEPRFTPSQRHALWTAYADGITERHQLTPDSLRVLRQEDLAREVELRDFLDRFVVRILEEGDAATLISLLRRYEETTRHFEASVRLPRRDELTARLSAWSRATEPALQDAARALLLPRR